MVTHPSPIKPAANKDWSALATGQLRKMGLEEVLQGRGETIDQYG